MLRQISGHGPLFARLACALLFLCAATAGNAAKTPPTATLTSPTSGASFFAPATIELAATASDPDGIVVRVDFFQGTTLIGTSTSEPFTATWSNVPAGSYTLTAKAIDNAGLTGTSAPVPITVNSATALLITSPGDGAALDIASGLTVTGTFEGEATTILVDNENSTILATVSGTSFSASFFDQPLAVGNNTITARLARPDKTAVTRGISVAGYDVPVVAFTSPAADTFAAPADILLGVDAKAPGGAVTQVDFYNGSELLSTVTTPPYQFNWTNVPFGTYTISARATSSHGPIGSATTIINVSGPNTLPTISITSPTEGAVFPNQSNIPLAVDASDPDGTVVTVEYFANGGLIGASNVAPFSLTWSNVATGSYALTARATDNREGQTTSAPVNITVAPPNQSPTVEISSPTSGSSFSVPGPVTLTATASDPDGTINRVEYYYGTTLIGSATTAPYAVNWTMVVPGTYQLTAKAFDNQGGDGVSQPITVTISGSVTYLHSDFAGNPIVATDVNGAVLWKENFRPYGDRLNNQPTAAGNRQWFHGKAVDADTGLSYFGARYYDPTVGRFMGIDPVGFSEKNLHGFNRYAYGNNNPHKFVDPDGNSPLSVFLIEVAKQTGVGYALGVGADAISQYAAFGQVDLHMAATSNAAIAGGGTGLITGAVSGAVKAWAITRIAASGKPLKNASGDVEAAANSARNQPYQREISEHANMRLQTRDKAVTQDALERAIAKGERNLNPQTGKTVHNLGASESPTGRGVTAVTNPRGGVVTAIDRGTRFEP